MRLLSIGTSFGGTWMQAALDNPHWEVAGCVARSSKSLKKAKKKFGIDDKYLYTDVREALDNTPDLDAVVVATPNDTHYIYSKMVIEKGYHLILEKPITENWAQAIELVGLLDKINAQNDENGTSYIKSCVGQTLRGDPMLRLMEYWLRDGIIGNIEGLTFQAYWNWVGDPKKSWRFTLPNMYLDDIGIHQFDTIRMMLGNLKCEKVFGQTFTPPSYPLQHIKTTAHAIFTMEGGIPVNYFGSQGTKGEEVGWYGIIKVFGDKGSMVKTPRGAPYVVLEKKKNKKIDLDDEDIEKYIDLTYEKIPYLLEDFYHAIKDDRPAITDLHDNINSHAMLLGVKKSAELNKQIVIKEEFPLKQST